MFFSKKCPLSATFDDDQTKKYTETTEPHSVIDLSSSLDIINLSYIIIMTYNAQYIKITMRVYSVHCQR